MNNEPVIFHKEIYAMAAILGGVTYWVLDVMSLPMEVTVITSFLVICLMRFLAVRYHLSLPTLKNE